MSGSAYRNLQMFGRLCGNVPLRRARLVTTMWDMVKDHSKLGVADDREKDLIAEFWKPLIAEGAIAKRFNNTSKSALQIIDELIGMEVAKDALLIQEELVKQHKRLDETEAGKLVDPRFQKLLAERRQTLKELVDDAKLRNDAVLARSLQEEYDQIDALLQRAFEDTKGTKTSSSKRGVLWLFGGYSGVSFAVFLRILIE